MPTISLFEVANIYIIYRRNWWDRLSHSTSFSLLLPRASSPPGSHSYGGDISTNPDLQVHMSQSTSHVVAGYYTFVHCITLQYKPRVQAWTSQSTLKVANLTGCQHLLVKSKLQIKNKSKYKMSMSGFLAMYC